MCFDDGSSSAILLLLLSEPPFVLVDLDHHAPETASIGAMHKSSAIATAGSGRRYLELRYLMVACVCACEPLLFDCAIMMFLTRFRMLSGFAETMPEQAGHKCFVSGHQVTPPFQ